MFGAVGHSTMAAKPRKSRPNEIAMDLSDAPSYGVEEANGQEGGAAP
jgi:hypothetical protein